MENSQKIFERVAQLSRLGPYQPKEAEQLGKDFARILDLFKVLEQLAMDQEKESAASGPRNVFREDECLVFENRQAILSNFPDKESSYLKVPKVME